MLGLNHLDVFDPLKKRKRSFTLVKVEGSDFVRGIYFCSEDLPENLSFKFEAYVNVRVNDNTNYISLINPVIQGVVDKQNRVDFVLSGIGTVFESSKENLHITEALDPIFKYILLNGAKPITQTKGNVTFTPMKNVDLVVVE